MSHLTAEQCLSEIARLRAKRGRGALLNVRLSRQRLFCHKLRELEGVFSPRAVATEFGCTVEQAHVAIYHLARRGEIVKVREATPGRYGQPALWKQANS